MTKPIKQLISKPAFRYPVLIMLSILIGIGAYALNATTLLQNRFPMPFGYGFSAILSGSMSPALQAGDLVIIKEQASYKEQDIVAYQYGSLGVIHRLIEIDGEHAITQGDANNIPDEPIPVTSIRGKVICRFPKIGSLVTILKSPISILAMILLALFLIEISYCTEKETKTAETAKLLEEINRLKQEMEQDITGEEGGVRDEKH